ncbi:MAG: metal-dependent transcriptional regulator [Candidatus Latescibacteria bacterium]|nr:metal-dependent transcriptional regulator [Candidatus Latescibacterota bacterium]
MATLDTWREFGKSEITHSVAHHLAAIHDLRERQGYARVSDVAEHLAITKGSVSLTLKALKEKGYVEEDRNKFLSLSEKSHQIVHRVLAKREIVKRFLTEVLRVDDEQAEIDACKVEHLLSVESGESLLHFVDFLLSDAPASQEFRKRFWTEDRPRPELEEILGDSVDPKSPS